MKKIIICLVGFLSIIIICSGCEADITRGIRHAGFTVSENRFVCSVFISEDDKYTNKIRYLSETFAIDQEGSVYELSLSQPFSNQQNCKKSAFSKNVAAIMDGQIVKATDGKLYNLTNSSNGVAYGEITASDSAYEIYQLLFSEAEILKIITMSQNEGIYYVLKTDGNIYKYVITRSDSRSSYSIISKEVIFSRETFGIILDFNYSSTAKNTNYILSQEALYRWKITNLDECSKYADKECVYMRYKDEALMDFSDHIIGFNGNLLITDYGREFIAER